jgi:DNA helicase-2/ATP-dependent DNA helicase PcrA
MHVDEYQDTNGIQARLTELLVGKEKNICVVGDMDQCLIEGTSVSMANGTEKPIEDIRKGEWVLSNYGSGDVRPARVTKTLTRSHSGTLITITTKTGRVITSTPQHIHFAGYRQGLTPDLYFTYLMQKQGIGWRLGVSQTYTNGQKSTVLGFQQRCNQEHGDAVWIIASHATPQEARILEYKLSLQYGIPTIPFVARKGGSTNGYVHDQKIINSIFASIHTEDVARKLLTDYNLSEIYPSHRAQATRSTRRNIIVSLCGDRRGASPMHRISLAGSDEAGKNILRIAGFSVRPAKLGSSGWRFETARASYDAIRIIVEKLQALFPEVHVRELARLGGKKKNPKDVSSLPFLPAASVQTGMVMFDAGGGYDIVERVDTVSNKKVRVFDLNIEKTHNFIGNGIVTHNCIYGWRGAQMENMLQFEKKYGGEVIVMEENYRSTKAILSAANSLISNNTGRPEKNLFTKNADGEPLSLYIAGDGGDEASFVARKIQEHIDEGRAPKDFAVLYRANFQSRSIEEKLLANHISYQVLGTRFFERKEVKDVLSFVRAGVSPNSADLGRVLDTLSGIGKVSKLKILSGQEAQLTRKAHERVVAMREVLSWIESTASTTPPSTLVREVIAKSGVEQTLKEDKLEGTERLENLAELVTLAARYDTLPAPEGLEKFLESAALASDQDDLKEEKNQVRLMTVHAAKGLEFPYVFIIGLEEGLFPYEREDDTKNNLEEERRLMYVALTRAQQKVYLSYAMMRTIFGNTEMRTNSQFLNELPGDLLQNEVPERLGKTIYLD